MIPKSNLLIAAAAACLIVPAVSARADAASDAKKAIQAQYNRSDAAAGKKDANGVTAVYTKDRLAVSSKGSTSNVENEQKQMKLVFATAQSITISSIITSVSLKGDTAVVQVKEHGKMVMPNQQTKGSTTLVEDTVSEDTWVKSGGTWLEKKSVEKSSTLSVNGKALGK